MQVNEIMRRWGSQHYTWDTVGAQNMRFFTLLLFHGSPLTYKIRHKNLAHSLAKLAQLAKVLIAKLHDVRSISRTHMVEREN